MLRRRPPERQFEGVTACVPGAVCKMERYMEQATGAAQADHMPARGAGSGATCGVGSGTTGGAPLDEVLHVGLDIGSTTTKVFVLDPTANETRYWRYQRHNARQTLSAIEALACVFHD